MLTIINLFTRCFQQQQQQVCLVCCCIGTYPKIMKESGVNFFFPKYQDELNFFFICFPCNLE